MICIYCKIDKNEPSEEHIVPDSLGCRPEWILKNGEVCNSCNNKLGNIDRALIETFDMQRFLAGVESKGGKPPAINTRGNVVGKIVGGEKTISINLSNKPATMGNGLVVGGLGKSDRNVKPTINVDGQKVGIGLSIKGGDHPKLSRALHKVAFGWAALTGGVDLVLSPQFDSVREFIVSGKGDRKVIILPPETTEYRHQFHGLNKFDNGYYAVSMRICQPEFVVDLSPDKSLFQRFFAHFKSEYGDTGWTYTPSDKS